MRRFCLSVATLVLVGIPPWAREARAEASVPIRIGVLGDSYSDEYQFYPPDRSTARNWVELLARIRRLDFGEFLETSRGEPRNEGFAFNWARSEATSSDALATGQLRGILEQLERGEVTYVVIFLGGNDFLTALNAADPFAALPEALERCSRNLLSIVDSIRDSRPAIPILVGTIPDVRNLPEVVASVRAGRLESRAVDATTAAIHAFNSRIRAIPSKHPKVAVMDLDAGIRLANLFNPRFIRVAGDRLDRAEGSNQPDHFFLADQRHLGTLGQSMIAQLVIEDLNRRRQAGIAPLSSAELRQLVPMSETVTSAASPER